MPRLTWCSPSGSRASPACDRWPCRSRCPVRCTAAHPGWACPTSTRQSWAGDAWKPPDKEGQVKCDWISTDHRLWMFFWDWVETAIFLGDFLPKEAMYHWIVSSFLDGWGIPKDYINRKKKSMHSVINAHVSIHECPTHPSREMKHVTCSFVTMYKRSCVTYLCDFPHDTDGPENAIVPDEQRLGHPAEEVTQNEHVHVRPQALQCHLRTVHSILLQQKKRCRMNTSLWRVCWHSYVVTTERHVTPPPPTNNHWYT